MGRSSKPVERYTIGQKFLLQGTGQWWKNAAYPATVVDVRKKDGTVKVQYADGGYKRYPEAEFEKLVVGNDDSSDSLAFGNRDYEWAEDALIPGGRDLQELTGPAADVARCQQAMNDAIKAKEYEKAEALRVERDAARREATVRRQEQLNLLAAIQREDFNAARDWQNVIDERAASEQKADAMVRAAAAGGGKGVASNGKAAAESPHEPKTFNADTAGEILSKAAARAGAGGMAGAAAMVIQVSSLMWMRTTMNYQYRYGMSTSEAMSALYKEGGVGRFYKGIGPALIQGPMSRFGDTAANAGVMFVLDNDDRMRDRSPLVKTLFSSAVASAWRVALMPVDTVKTMMQVEGNKAMPKLRAKLQAGGPTVMFHGAIGASAATFAGHYPWFATYNYLQAAIPVPEDMLPKLGRNAVIGFCSSAVSDTVSNSIRVLKTYRQTSDVKISYMEAANNVIKQDGLAGLFGRGLKTRILANGAQGMMFSVMWKYFEDLLKKE